MNKTIFCKDLVPPFPILSTFVPMSFQLLDVFYVGFRSIFWGPETFSNDSSVVDRFICIIIQKSRAANIGPDVDFFYNKHFSFNSLRLKTQLSIPYTSGREYGSSIPTSSLPKTFHSYTSALRSSYKTLKAGPYSSRPSHKV